eukprot:7931902-Pyramimonas_sp.AAC.1
MAQWRDRPKASNSKVRRAHVCTEKHEQEEHVMTNDEAERSGEVAGNQDTPERTVKLQHPCAPYNKT